MARIENWAIINNDDGYTAPEALQFHIIGDVYNHTLKPDGSSVRTSSIISMCLKERYIETKNTKYMLGRMKRGYLKFLRENNPKLYKEWRSKRKDSQC